MSVPAACLLSGFSTENWSWEGDTKERNKQVLNEDKPTRPACWDCAVWRRLDKLKCNSSQNFKSSIEMHKRLRGLPTKASVIGCRGPVHPADKIIFLADILLVEEHHLLEPGEYAS